MTLEEIGVILHQSSSQLGKTSEECFKHFKTIYEEIDPKLKDLDSYRLDSIKDIIKKYRSKMVNLEKYSYEIKVIFDNHTIKDFTNSFGLD